MSTWLFICMYNMSVKDISKLPEKAMKTRLFSFACTFDEKFMLPAFKIIYLKGAVFHSFKQLLK